MFKYIVSLSLVVLIWGCGGNTDQANESGTDSKPGVTYEIMPPYITYPSNEVGRRKQAIILLVSECSSASKTELCKLLWEDSKFQSDNTVYEFKLFYGGKPSLENVYEVVRANGSLNEWLKNQDQGNTFCGTISKIPGLDCMIDQGF